MKRILAIICIGFISVFTIGCDGDTSPQNGDNGIVDENGRDDNNGDSDDNGSGIEEASLSDYYPIESNNKYVYSGEGNEYASFERYVDYISEDGNTVQYREENPGTTMAIVIERREDEIVQVYSRGEAYYRENYIVNPTLQREDEKMEDVLLKSPIEEGNSWTLEDGRTRTITDTDVNIEVPNGEYSAIEVTTEGDEYENKDYYAAGIGHIKSEFISEDGSTVSSSLENIEEDASFVDQINFYYPDLNEDTYYYKPTDVEFKTNDITRAIIGETYRSESIEGLGKVFTPNTSINYLFADRNGHAYIDLTRDFISEMNAGAYYESMILDAVGLTIGDYYNQASRVYLRIDGNRYESGHIIIEKNDYIEVNYNNRKMVE